MTIFRSYKLFFIIFILIAVFSAAKRYDETQARIRLGGDYEIVAQRPLNTAASVFIAMHSRTRSRITTANVEITRHGDAERSAVSATLKGIDKHYPLYGALTFEKKTGKSAFTQRTRKSPTGAAVNTAFMESAGIGVGQRFKAGGASYVISAVIADEPDGGNDTAPRMPVRKEGTKTYIRSLAPEQSVSYRYRALLDKGHSLDDVKENFRKRFGDDIWVYRDWRDETYWPLGAASWPLTWAALLASALGAMLGFARRRKQQAYGR